MTPTIGTVLTAKRGKRVIRVQHIRSAPSLMEAADLTIRNLHRPDRMISAYTPHGEVVYVKVADLKRTYKVAS